MKRVRFVKFTFTAEFDSDSDCDAVTQAAIGLKYGIDNAKRLHLEVTGLGPLPLQPPAPIDEPKSVEQPAAEGSSKWSSVGQR